MTSPSYLSRAIQSRVRVCLCVAFSFLAFCLLLTKRVFLLCRCCDLADVDGGRLQLYQSVPFDRYQIVREERRREAFAKVEKQKMEEQRLLAVVNKWENVDRSKAAVALKRIYCFAAACWRTFLNTPLKTSRP